jgi:hypothetical protein
MKKSVHTLCLRNNKWFLYVSNCPADNWNYVCKESATLFEYVRENTALMVFDTAPYVDIFELNTLVKRYMKYYGVENVRGGSYSDPVLPEHIIKSIEDELFRDTGVVNDDILLIEDIQRTYEDRYQTPDDIAEEIRRLQRDLEKYLAIKEKCHFITTNRTVFDDFEWIKQRALQVKTHCATYTDSKPPILSDIDVKKYKMIIEKMQQITIQFNVIKEDLFPIYDDSPLLLEKPYVQLDTLFYHSHLIHDWTIYFSRIEKLLNYFEYMSWVLVNRSEEFHFDIGQYENNFEKRTECAIQYLQQQSLTV